MHPASGLDTLVVVRAFTTDMAEEGLEPCAITDMSRVSLPWDSAFHRQWVPSTSH